MGWDQMLGECCCGEMQMQAFVTLLQSQLPPFLDSDTQKASQWTTMVMSMLQIRGTMPFE